MTTALRTAAATDTTAPPRPADACVAFGITGDLARVMTVLSLVAMNGDSTRFARQHSVDETWCVMQPLVSAPPPVHPYPPGSWGPDAADALLAADGGWRGPCVVAS